MKPTHRLIRYEGPDGQHIGIGIMLVVSFGKGNGRIEWPDSLPPERSKLINRGSGGDLSIPTYRLRFDPRKVDA